MSWISVQCSEWISEGMSWLKVWFFDSDFKRKQQDKEEKEDKEDKERRKHEASEEEDLKSILLAVDLSWERIGLMERRGFKVGCLNKQQKYLMLFLKQ